MIDLSLQPPETIHPSLWRASQLARGAAICIDTGHAALSAELPGRGWPLGSLNELLLQQHGAGELRLLAPALQQLKQRRIVLLQPPYIPQALALTAMGLAPSQLLWIRTARNANTLWAAEQILRADSCGVLLCWQEHAPNAALRRLHLAAQGSNTLFFMLRPQACAPDSSPAPLRLHVSPAAGGLQISLLKRRGPQRDTPLFIALPPSDVISPSTGFSTPLHAPPRHATLDRLAPAAAAAGNVSSALVG